MRRCLQLASLGAGHVAPNPMVGAVLVHQDRIIGEGYHRNYGEAHAEVNCLASVSSNDKALISRSTLYVSLEPCAHFGKTPPCADMIISEQIPRVVIGSRDPFREVNGRGIEKLRKAGVEVTTDVLETECLELNKRFFCFHQQHRPHVTLKWAQTVDGMIGSGSVQRLMISGELSNRKVHKWRSEEAAILVGTNTALYDNPSLDVRSWKGRNPLRIVVDMDLSLPPYLNLFSDGGRTLVVNTLKHGEEGMLMFYQVTEDVSLVHQLLNACVQLNIHSLLVEGGARMLQSFIDHGAWDEARVITNTAKYAGTGLPAPVLNGAKLMKKEMVDTDSIVYFAPDVKQR